SARLCGATPGHARLPLASPRSSGPKSLMKPAAKYAPLRTTPLCSAPCKSHEHDLLTRSGPGWAGSRSPRGGLLLAGEPFPCGLPGDLEGGTDARPGHPALAQDGDQPLEVRLGLVADRGHAREQVK